MQQGGAAPEPGEQPPADASAADDADDVDGAGGATEAAADAPPPVRDVAQLEAELADLGARHARAAADYQNLRRRQAEERREHLRLTTKAMVLNYLPVLDDLRRALDTVLEHDEIAGHQWVEGIRMVERKFLAVLEAGGVEEIAAAGAAFDPERHEAVAFQPGADGQVMAVVQHGYAIGGQVVRPAMVLVGNGEAAPGGAAAPTASDDTPQSDAPEDDAPGSRGHTQGAGAAAGEPAEDADTPGSTKR